MNDTMTDKYRAPASTDSRRMDESASPEQLEHQIDQRRSRISDQLDQLEERFSPQQLLEQGMDLFKGQGGDALGNLGRSFRDNPAPFIITGVGLAWLMSATSGPSGKGYRAQDDYDNFRGHRGYDAPGMRYSNFSSHDSGEEFEQDELYDPDSEFYTSEDSDGESLTDRVSEAAGEAKRRASNLLDSASEDMKQRRRQAMEHSRRFGRDSMQRMHDERRYAEQQTRRGAEQVSDYFQQQPLIGGLLGLAAGALIGSLLPPTEVENRIMGESSDSLKKKAAENAESGAELAREKIESAASSARHSVEERLDEKKGERKKEREPATEKAEIL